MVVVMCGAVICWLLCGAWWQHVLVVIVVNVDKKCYRSDVGSKKGHVTVKHRVAKAVVVVASRVWSWRFW